MAHDERGAYRGLYEWDGADRATHYARSLWRVLALVSEQGSIGYRVVPGVGRDEALAEPALLAKGFAEEKQEEELVARGRRLRTSAEVLVVGAGPTGLTTALQAHDHGAEVRVVERRPEAFRPSRAMIMHPRTLESLRPLGVTDALLARGDRAPAAQLRLGRRRVPVQLGEAGLRDTSFPHLTMVRQMDVEQVLMDALEARGVEVERGLELVDASTSPPLLAPPCTATDGSRRSPAGSSPVATARTAPSVVPRPSAGRAGPTARRSCWPTSRSTATWRPDSCTSSASRPGLVFLFALGEGATWRLMSTRPGPDADAPTGRPGRRCLPRAPAGPRRGGTRRHAQ